MATPMVRALPKPGIDLEPEPPIPAQPTLPWRRPCDGPRPPKLNPPAIGKRDRALAAVVFRHMQDTNPPLVIEWNPVIHSHVRKFLAGVGIYL